MDPEVAGSKPVIHPNSLSYSMLSKRIVREFRWPMPDLSGFEVLVQVAPIAASFHDRSQQFGVTPAMSLAHEFVGTDKEPFQGLVSPDWPLG